MLSSFESNLIEGIKKIKEKLVVVFDYYPLIFSFITLLFCVPIFVNYNKYLNIIICFLGLLMFLFNLNKIRFVDFGLEMIFLLILGLSILVSGRNFLFQNIEKFALCFLEIILLLHFSKFSTKLNRNIRLIKIEVIVFSFIVSLISIILYKFGFHMYWKIFELGNIGRDLVGIYTHPNVAGIVAAISIIFSLMLCVESKKNKKIYSFLAVNIILQLLIIFLAHSNASIIIICTYIGFEVIFYYIKKYKEKTVTLNNFIFAPSVMIIVEKLANGRLKLWKIGIDLIKNNLWLGVSPAAVKDCAIKFGNITKKSTLYAIERGGFHNSFIQLFAGVGIFGGMTAIIIILKNIVQGLKNSLVNSKYISLCLAILVYCLFESSLFFISAFLPIIFWIFLGSIGSNEVQ